VFDSRVLRRVFGPKKEKVAGGWKRLHNEEFHNLYTSPNIIRELFIKENEMDKVYSTHGGFGWNTWWEETTWETWP
jgi:hypothetical protein